MILGGLAVNSGFSAREIERFDVGAAMFWHNAIAAFYARIEEQSS